MSNVLEQIQKNLYDGEVDAVREGTEKALAEGLAPADILQNGLIAGMDIVGRDFRADVLFIPEVLLCARAMHAGLEVLRPRLAESDAPSLGRIVIGTVAGDLHDIGKNLVSMMLEGAGFEVIDLGVDVRAEKFVEALKSSGAGVLGMSAMLTTTMPYMNTVVEALVEAGIRDKVKVLVGGAPVTASFAKTVGADAYGADAASAVDTARAFAAR
jgi:5-methyltetrahydrofolate--homocysteine methyltransferase